MLPVATALMILALLLATSRPAGAEILVVGDGGINDAAGCTTEDCIGTQTFALGAAAPVSGTIELDTSTPSMSFDLSVLSVRLLETVMGTEDNGVAEVEFSDTTYAASDLTVTEGPPGSFTISFPSTAMISGDQTQRNDVGGAVNGTPASFDEPTALVTGNCFFVAPDEASCSLTFGTTDFTLSVGDPTPEGRYFRHTMNLIARRQLVPALSPLQLGSVVVVLLLTGRSRLRRRTRSTPIVSRRPFS